ncbi:dihydroorotate oxidase electron transfer subunit [Cryobacterium cryoconiti]|uniref:Dihydroorotate oxidase electron transfer subunit n=1 Tax=Cryobacterium cryoconiti TaxID=1259239 RepID=A0A4Y8JRP6_9MICO|nr:dihydroorotate oxidase electron transfer subunit [Cryobacterium cryoconiti]TFD26830.1 dihydroorotate oxidase electron transfer subunit [Cryobacterium cryoconiti]
MPGTPAETPAVLAARDALAALRRQQAFAAADEAALDGLIAVRPPARTPRPDPVWDDAPVLVHEVVGERYRRLVLRTATIATTALAGQFLMITVPPKGGERILLPRPMAIHRRHPEQGTVEVIYGVAGRGTTALADVVVGESLLVTGPLGRGFEFPDAALPTATPSAGPGPQPARTALMIGRGVGVCAIMGSVEDAADQGISATVVLSGRSRANLIGLADCAELGATVIPVTDDDGSSALPALGERLRARFAATPPDVILVCGAGVLARLAAELGSEWDVPVQVSLEAHMACGLGYCHGCAAPVATDPAVEGPLVCVDGPVFDAVLPLTAAAGGANAAG